MGQALAQAAPAGEIMESVVIKGDLSKLTPEERSRYYMEVCKSVGLNPLTRPMEYITLNGKLTLYARRDAADQLRKINNISVEIVERSVADDLFTVHVRAKDGNGRTDEDLGVVTIGNLKGEARANAILKAITKAKRRVTLSISGMGFLDETEIEDIPAHAKAPVPSPVAIAPPKVEPPHNPETGEVGPHAVTIPIAADGQRSDWIAWGRSLIAGIKTAKSREEVDSWALLNNAALSNASEQAPKAHKSVMAALDAMREKFPAPVDGDILTIDDAPTILSGG